MAIFNSYVSLLEVDRIWNVPKDSHFSEDSLKCPYFVYPCPMQTNVWRAGFVLHLHPFIIISCCWKKNKPMKSPWHPINSSCYHHLWYSNGIYMYIQSMYICILYTCVYTLWLLNIALQSGPFYMTYLWNNGEFP